MQNVPAEDWAKEYPAYVSHISQVVVAPTTTVVVAPTHTVVVAPKPTVRISPKVLPIKPVRISNVLPANLASIGSKLVYQLLFDIVKS